MVAASPAAAATLLAAVCCSRAATPCAPAAMQAVRAASPSVAIRSAAVPVAEPGSTTEACLASPERGLSSRRFSDLPIIWSVDGDALRQSTPGWNCGPFLGGGRDPFGSVARVDAYRRSCAVPLRLGGCRKDLRQFPWWLIWFLEERITRMLRRFPVEGSEKESRSTAA